MDDGGDAGAAWGAGGVLDEVVVWLGSGSSVVASESTVGGDRVPS